MQYLSFAFAVAESFSMFLHAIGYPLRLAGQDVKEVVHFVGIVNAHFRIADGATHRMVLQQLAFFSRSFPQFHPFTFSGLQERLV